MNLQEVVDMVKAIVGGNWGDEGKGKITDLLAGEADIVVRYQGGANAGHTIINEYGKFALHLLPSGIFHQSVVNVIGPGVALDIEALLRECLKVSLVKKNVLLEHLYHKPLLDVDALCEKYWALGQRIKPMVRD